MSCSSSEWSNYNHQTSLYDQTSTISYVTPPNYMLTSSDPTSVATPNQSKPTKRKSRGSKKGPTTILKAEVSDFRSLVQQLTGRPNGPINVGAYKGPLNINFGEQDEGHQVDLVSSKMLPFGHNTNNKYDQHINKMPKRPQNHQQGHEDVVESRTSSSLSSVAPNNHESGVGFDDFDVDDICFEELAWLPSSNGTCN